MSLSPLFLCLLPKLMLWFNIEGMISLSALFLSGGLDLFLAKSMPCSSPLVWVPPLGFVAVICTLLRFVHE
jgi:hypothetical protein